MPGTMLGAEEIQWPDHQRNNHTKQIQSLQTLISAIKKINRIASTGQ